MMKVKREGRMEGALRVTLRMSRGERKIGLHFLGFLYHGNHKYSNENEENHVLLTLILPVKLI